MTNETKSIAQQLVEKNVTLIEALIRRSIAAGRLKEIAVLICDLRSEAVMALMKKTGGDAEVAACREEIVDAAAKGEVPFKGPSGFSVGRDRGPRSGSR
jgi:hypothetical protein